MYRNEFDNLLRQGNTFDAYMFYGQSSYLVEKYTQIVSSKLCVDEPAMKLYFDEFDLKQAYNLLSQSSLFSANNTLIVKLDKPLNKKDTTTLIEACNLNDASTVIFSCTGDADFRTMDKYFGNKTKSVAIRMFSPYPNEALKFIQDEAKALNIQYDIAALQHLYMMHKEDLSLCINDLKKLSILDDKITSGDVDTHCFGFTSISLDDFIFNLLSAQNIDKDIRHLLESGTNEIYLINQITSYIQQLFMINAYARTIGQPNAKEILGYSPPKPIWEKKARLAISIKPQKYLEMLRFILDLELELKSSKIDQPKTYIQAMLRKFSVHFR
ncbi:MAG: DNA polymerase III subunit delta [Campylobacterota bacterium]|nr:DNA polymerase III subunit delta [Campylobacterota bacterium]